MIYITAASSTTVGTSVDGILLQVNKSLTGSITLAAGGVTFAVIQDPTVGAQFRYNGLRGLGAVTVTPSATTDITVSLTGNSL